MGTPTLPKGLRMWSLRFVAAFARLTRHEGSIREETTGSYPSPWWIDDKTEAWIDDGR